jgi:hypothetical protein
VVGSAVGSFEGFTEGSRVGIFVGFNDGFREGLNVGGWYIGLS